MASFELVVEVIDDDAEVFEIVVAMSVLDVAPIDFSPVLDAEACPFGKGRGTIHRE